MEPEGIEAARLSLRDAGYCVGCNRIVVRRADGCCPQGHAAEAIAAHLMLADDDPIPHLGRFNVAAFLVPWLWGPVHGQWAGAFFLMVWLFADGAIASAGEGALSLAGAAVIACSTLAAQAWFASRANGLAWRRVADRVPLDRFRSRQRWWAIGAFPVAAGVVAWATWFHTVFSAQ